MKWKWKKGKPFYSVNFIWKILHDKWSNQNLLDGRLSRSILEISIHLCRKCCIVKRKRQWDICETINDDDLSVSKVIERRKLSMFEVSRVLLSAKARERVSKEQILWHNISSSTSRLKCEKMIVKLLFYVDDEKAGEGVKGLWNLNGKLKNNCSSCL